GSADLSVSPAFYPGATDVISDTVFLSSDAVLFYIHSDIVTSTQPNAFRRLLGFPLTDTGCRDRIIKIEESSSVLAVMLHVLYNTPCSPAPSLEAIVTAVDRMRMYEISPALQLAPATHLYKQILSFAPVRPLDVYALAAFHRLDDMAVEASSHLISYPLSAITDGVASRIGTYYLLRLFQWRMHRTAEMKRILLKSPFPHPPTRRCGLGEQNPFFNTELAELAFGVSTDLTLSLLRPLLDPHLHRLECALCKEVIENRIRDIIIEW
ncbi:hypothetical protein P691DRAFT_650349, partial [Macrolepiota fuliginosa MF-IS2]